jgi:hypothetical protein
MSKRDGSQRQPNRKPRQSPLKLEEHYADLDTRKKLGISRCDREMRNLRRRRKVIREIVPTSVWYDDWRDGAQFPPPADTRWTEMRPVAHPILHSLPPEQAGPTEAKTLWPRYYHTSQGGTFEGHLFEVFGHRGVYDGTAAGTPTRTYTTDSPSAEAFQIVEMMRQGGLPLVVEQVRLMPEDDGSLRREIETFEQTGFTGDQVERLREYVRKHGRRKVELAPVEVPAVPPVAAKGRPPIARVGQQRTVAAGRS